MPQHFKTIATRQIPNTRTNIGPMSQPNPTIGSSQTGNPYVILFHVPFYSLRTLPKKPTTPFCHSSNGQKCARLMYIPQQWAVQPITLNTGNRRQLGFCIGLSNNGDGFLDLVEGERQNRACTLCFAFTVSCPTYRGSYTMYC